MEKTKIEEYIERGLELELLDKLNSYVINGFDFKCENLIKILIILQEKAKIDWRQPNRALVNVITKILPNIVNENDLTRFADLVRNSAVAPYEKISYLNRQFIIGIEDKDDSIIAEISMENLELFQRKLQQLNGYFLDKAIESGADYFSLIDLLYNCVDRLGEERKVFITESALNSFRGYIYSQPKGYITHFIRPYYSGTSKVFIDHFYHVPEPFYKQIFSDGQFSFSDFLTKSRNANIDDDLSRDVLEFFNRIQDVAPSGSDKRLILFSEEMKSLDFDNLERFLKLHSSDHVLVRKECLPPLYKE